jgi:hypothetical protein
MGIFKGVILGSSRVLQSEVMSRSRSQEAESTLTFTAQVKEMHKLMEKFDALVCGGSGLCTSLS